MKTNDDVDNVTWHRSSNGSEISFGNIVKEIDAHKAYTIHVGTDSHHSRIFSRKFIFSTTICLYLEGKGGFYFFYKKTPKIKYSCLADRLIAEVNRSVSVANKIQSLISNRQISVHVDVNKDVKFKSGKFCPMFKSWVESLGFVYIPKPDSWASTGVADRHAK